MLKLIILVIKSLQKNFNEKNTGFRHLILKIFTMCYFSKLMITKERSFKPKFFCFNDLQFVSPFRCSGIVSAPWSRLPSKSSSNSVSNSNSIRFPVSKKCYSFFSHFLLLQSTFSKMQFLKFHWKSDDQDFWPTLRNLDYSFNWNSFTF